MSLIVTDNPYQNPNEGQFSIRLSDINMRLAMDVAYERRLGGLGKEGRRGQEPDTRWDNDVHGACGECALAKHLGWFWDGGTKGVYTEADVGILQVKGTHWHNGKLLLHEDTPDNEIFILATMAHLPWVELRGWLYGNEAKQAQFKDEPQKGRPCFGVMQAYLHSMTELPDFPKK